MPFRFSLLITAIIGAYAALFFRLYSLQIQQGSSYIKSVEAQAAGELAIAERGSIYFTDKNGKALPVATTKDFPLVYGTPKSIEDPLETAHAVAAALDIDPEPLVSKLGKPGDNYELIERKVSGERAERVQEAAIPGIYVKSVSERFYPFGELAAHVLGFVAPNNNEDLPAGRYGLEKFYNEELAGKPGGMNKGEVVLPIAGKDIHLTIDPNVQIEIEQILDDLISKHQAVGGSIIIEDPATGKILAMTSRPKFNPNDYQKAEIGDFLNPVTQQIYEPGSVFKVITMAAGIDAGKITPYTTFNDTGVLMVSGKKIQNWDLQAHGLVTMTNIIEKSLNTGAAYAEKLTGHDNFRKYLNAFGFSDKTNLDLPGELKGDLKRLAPGAPAIAYATASFGQGVAITPIELVNAIAAIANGGMLMRPYVNAEMNSKSLRRVIKPETAQAVTQMMVSAVDKAEVAKIDGYTFAGKTGTAQVPDFKHGGYSADVIHSYVGFGPTANPKFVILLKLDKPAGAPLAGQTVVPAFRDLAQFLVNYFNIPPDRIR